MNRRAFIAGLGSTAAWPVAGRAQQPDVPVTIGFLGIGPASVNVSRIEGLRSGLKEAGYREGGNLLIEFRWADIPAQLSGLAAELVQRRVALIVSGGNSAASAAKAATSTIPIVFSSADDPVRLGYVSSFNRPGGNMTGVSMISGELGAKRLQLIRELLPDAAVIASLADPHNPAEEGARSEQASAQTGGQRAVTFEASNVAEIEQAFAAMARQRVDALIVNADALFTAERQLLVTLSAHYRLPASYSWREFPEAGGLMSYGTSFRYNYHNMGLYAGRILKGASPADLPVMQPTRFELVINLRTAKALGLTIPDKLLALADEVIE